MFMRTARERDSASAMQTAERRVAESCVDNAIRRCAATGIDVTRGSMRALLVAEMKLSELGVACDLVGQMIELEQHYVAMGMRGTLEPRVQRVQRVAPLPPLPLLPQRHRMAS